MRQAHNYKYISIEALTINPGIQILLMKTAAKISLLFIDANGAGVKRAK